MPTDLTFVSLAILATDVAGSISAYHQCLYALEPAHVSPIKIYLPIFPPSLLVIYGFKRTTDAGSFRRHSNNTIQQYMRINIETLI